MLFYPLRAFQSSNVCTYLRMSKIFNLIKFLGVNLGLLLANHAMHEVWLFDNFVVVLRLFGKYTMEVILTNAFGRYVDIQNADSDDELTKSAASLFSETKEGSNFNILFLTKWICKRLCVFTSYHASNKYKQLNLHIYLWICLYLLMYMYTNVQGILLFAILSVCKFICVYTYMIIIWEVHRLC